MRLSPLLALLSAGCLTSSADYQDLLAWASDTDLDGFAPRDGDCDDGDPSVHPDAEDIWYDGVDQDCDGWDDFDADRDGSPSPSDCDDTDPLVAPGVAEECDGVDEDCDGEVDEGMVGAWYLDEDGDGQGDDETAIETCLPPSGHVDVGGDCDDGDPGVYTGAVEVCGDGVLNDCAGYDGSCRTTGEVSLGDYEGEVVMSAMWGDAHGDFTGESVAMGDIDADGLAELLIGAGFNDRAGTDAGAAYLVTAPLPEDEEWDLMDDTQIIYRGESSGDLAGKVVGFAFNLNGDGKDVPLLSGSDASGSSGVVYVNPPTSRGVHDLGTSGVLLELSTSFQEGALTGVGDVNGDGANEFAIGHADADGNTGVVHIWQSPSGDQPADQGMATLSGHQPLDKAGLAIAPPADFNGDGVGDMLVSAPNHDTHRGVTYMVLGPIRGNMALNTSDAILTGENYTDHAGISLGAGDVDGDGLDDMLIGAPDAVDGDHTPGKAYLLLGAPVGTLDLANARLTLTGETNMDALGAAVSLSSDLDGDGSADIVVSSMQGGGGDHYGSGFVSVWYEPLSGAVGPSDAELTIYGEGSQYFAGKSLAGGYDANSDAADDLLVGSPRYGSSANQVGAAHVLLGSGL